MSPCADLHAGNGTQNHPAWNARPCWPSRARECRNTEDQCSTAHARASTQTSGFWHVYMPKEQLAVAHAHAGNPEVWVPPRACMTERCFSGFWHSRVCKGQLASTHEATGTWHSSQRGHASHAGWPCMPLPARIP